MTTKEFSYSDVSEHSSKKDLYLVIHDKVYNATSFVDEHPYVAFFNLTPLRLPLLLNTCSVPQQLLERARTHTTSLSDSAQPFQSFYLQIIC